MKDDNERQDFVVEVRMVFPKSVSRFDLYQTYKGSTSACAKDLLGAERRIPEDFIVTVAGFANDGKRYL